MRIYRPELPSSISIIIQRCVQEPAAGHVRLKVFQAAAPLGPWPARFKKIAVCALNLHKQQAPGMYK
jgi:hypothetical protein